MDDLAALVAAVAANPDDDHVRLIAADWLDEHPEPEPCPGCGGKRLTEPPPRAATATVAAKVDPHGRLTGEVRVETTVRW